MNIFDINNTLTIILGYSLSYIELLGTITGLLSVWFATKQNILTWTTGILNIICFFTIFYQVHLYSDMFLQVYFFITSIYGWITWRNQKQNDKPISLLSNKHRLSYIFLILILSLILGIFIKNIHILFPNIFSQPASFPFTDTFIAVSSIIATVFLAKRILENWILWIFIDIICVFVYAKRNIFFISIEYAVFFLLASYGLFLWIKTLKDEKRISIG